VVSGENGLPQDTRLLPLSVEHFNVIREGLVQAVNGSGTAQRARARAFTIAGKTGTSQVVGRRGRKPPDAEETELDESLLPHSLFVGYAPAEDPQVAVVVLVEHGESGGRVAAPIARSILEFYSRSIEPLESRFPDARAEPGAPQTFRRTLHDAFSTVGGDDEGNPAPSGAPSGAAPAR
jgi:penicillin-binding protein 2